MKQFDLRRAIDWQWRRETIMILGSGEGSGSNGKRETEEGKRR